MKIVITGTSKGIGRAIALHFLDYGHDVIGIDRLVSSIANSDYKHIMLDIRDQDKYPDLTDVDILINNAGTQNEDDININLISTIHFTEHIIKANPNIKSILMIGSASAHTGAEFPEYAASKGGLLSYTKNVALRIASNGGICNSLDPGGVTTELNLPVMSDPNLWQQIMDVTPLKRWASAEEMAEWAYFLTVKNRFMTGQNLLVDGGEALNSTFIWPNQT